MTWAEWCSSAYNTGNYVCDNGVYIGGDSSWLLLDNVLLVYVSPSDHIIDSTGRYFMVPGGSIQ